MPFLPWFRITIFILITLFSLAVLGLCAYAESQLSEGLSYSTPILMSLGLAAASVTIVSLPLFLALGNLQNRVFTSTILFEIIWFFVLWLLWAGTAGASVAVNEYQNGYQSEDCVGTYYGDFQNCGGPTGGPLWIVVEAFAFLNFFCAFIYYDAIFLYAIINAIRGRGVWTASLKEAATAGRPEPGVQKAQYNAAPGVPYQNYNDAYPSNTPPGQLYNPYPQQVPAQWFPAQPYPQQVQGPPGQPYSQQVPLQGAPPPPQYNAYFQQAAVQGFPPGQNQSYYYPPAPGTPSQQGNYAGAFPPQPNYTAYLTSDAEARLPLPSGYLTPQPSPQQQPVPSWSTYPTVLV